MTDAEVLKAAEKLSGCPRDQMMAYARTDAGAVVINTVGQKFRYTEAELAAALEPADEPAEEHRAFVAREEDEAPPVERSKHRARKANPQVGGDE